MEVIKQYKLYNINFLINLYNFFINYINNIIIFAFFFVIINYSFVYIYILFMLLNIAIFAVYSNVMKITNSEVIAYFKNFNIKYKFNCGKKNPFYFL